MRISDWSSDVCSSDLTNPRRRSGAAHLLGRRGDHRTARSGTMTDLTAYRSAARAWIEGKIAEFGREARRGLTPAEDLALGRRYLAAKYEAGYSGISWPRENGGQGLSPTEKLAFDREEILHGFRSEEHPSELK